MTTKQRREWRELCLKAVHEPDPTKQMEIVAELNRMLERREKTESASQVFKQRPSR